MTKHFATSWLQSLSQKLQALTEWSWAADKRGDCTTHRNLFREFFSAQFGKTLALVDQVKKAEFLGVIERNLYKFDVNTQQYPLMCLCALLQHGKESVETQEKVIAWVSFLLERLRRPPGSQGTTGGASVAEVVEECLSAPFQKFIPLMEESLRARLANGLGERLAELSDDMQRRVMDDLPAVPARIEEVVVSCTKELNEWLEAAPVYPATPLSLADTLAKLEHPLVRFFTAVKHPARKEAFLVATALALQGLRTRFRWMTLAEPELESLSSELQRKLFTVEGQGPVMEMWLSSRLKKYNAEVASRSAALIQGNLSFSERLRVKLQSVFPARSGVEEDDEKTWFVLDGLSSLAKGLLAWLSECDPDFMCPQHTLARDTLTGVLQRFPHTFEVDMQRMRARLRLPSAAVVPQHLQGTLASVLAIAPPTSSSPATGTVVLPPVMRPPPVPGTGVAGLALSSGGSLATSPSSASTVLVLGSASLTPSSSGPEVDNLVDLLLNEALQTVPPEVRIQINKVGHGVYRMGSKEVTLHTTNGRLFVYRIGEVVRNVPIETLLKEEGLLQGAPTASTLGALASSTSPLSATSSAAPFSVPLSIDSSAVARITMQSKQISSGVSSTVASAASSGAVSQMHFGRKPDEQALLSKRVEAATKAMNVSKQIARRSVNFDDEKLLRKLLSKGLKHDEQWKQAYQDYCSNRGVVDIEPKSQNKEFVSSFIENNFANSINKEWVKKIMEGGDGEGERKHKRDKREKKEKKKKGKDKEKKRKASETSSSGEAVAGTGGGVDASDVLVPVPNDGSEPTDGAARTSNHAPAGSPSSPRTTMQAVLPTAGVDLMSFGAFGMPPYGMGMMGMPGGMMGAMPPMLDPGMMSMGMGIADDRSRKRARKEEKGERTKKAKIKR